MQETQVPVVVEVRYRGLGSVPGLPANTLVTLIILIILLQILIILLQIIIIIKIILLIIKILGCKPAWMIPEFSS